MSEGITAQDRQSNSGIITKGISSGTLDLHVCYKIGNIVTVGARIHSITNQDAGSENVWFHLPSGFIPRFETRCFGYMQIDDVGFVPILANIYPNGEVKMFYSATKTVSQLGFCATYSI